MNQPMVVTNVRMPYTDYIQVKSIAGEFNMSVNEYINYATRSMNKTKQLFHSTNKKSVNPYSALWKIIHSTFPKKPMGLSKEDEAIYSI